MLIVKKYGQTVTSDTVVEALHPLVQDALERHALKVVVDDIIKALPQRQELIVSGGCGLGGVIQVRDRSKAALGELQDLSHSVFVRGPGEHVASLGPSDGLQEIGPVEQ